MEENIALSKDSERKFKRKVNKTKNKVLNKQIVLKDDFEISKKLKPQINKNISITETVVKPARLKKPKAERGLIYIGHIPHGFYENEMRNFFKQFGRVTNCRVNRSAKTGASKGFGYVEFKNTEVAKIAAETMDNYLMFKRRLITKYIPPVQQKVNIFRAPGWSKINYPMKHSRQKANRVYNNNTYINYEEECKGMIKSIEIKLGKLKEMGISYDFKINDIPDCISGKSIISTEELFNDSEEEFSYVDDSDDPTVQFKVAKSSAKNIYIINNIKIA